MRFSLFFFSGKWPDGRGDHYRLFRDSVRYADEHDFEAVWTPERHFHAFGGLYPNPSVASAAIAAITQRVAIRAGSCVSPLHHPIRIAEEWALVDNLSRGRVGVSFASGWQPDDFVLRPENHAQAKQVMLDDIERVRRLWRGEKLRFPGPKGEVEVRTLPRPVQPELPVWVTSAGNPETFRQAGEIGAFVLTHLLGQTTLLAVGPIATEIAERFERVGLAAHRAILARFRRPAQNRNFCAFQRREISSRASARAILAGSAPKLHGSSAELRLLAHPPRPVPPPH